MRSYAQDLGCGDAGPIAKLVSAAAEHGRPLVRKYTGVDLSKPALALAQANLARCPPCSCEECKQQQPFACVALLV